MQTHVFIPATIERPVYDAGMPGGRFVTRARECTIIAFVGVGTSHGDGSYSTDVLAVAMFADGQTISERVTAFTILPALDLEPTAEVL